MPLLASCDTRSAFEMTFEGRKLPVPTIRANDMINTDQNVEGGPPSSGKNPRAGDSRISSAIGGERQFRPRLTPPPAYHKCLSRRSRHSRIAAPAGCWSAHCHGLLDSFQYLSRCHLSCTPSVRLLMSQTAADRY